MPVRADITKTEEWFTGVDKVLQFTVVDDAAAAVNITGWALRWVMATRPPPPAGSTTIISRTTGGSGISITNAAAGICQVTVSDDLTDGIPGERTYYHELRRTDAGNEDVLAYGDAYLRQSPIR